MKHCIITICLLASFIGGIQAQSSQRYSIESAVRFIELARAAEQGKQPSEADWEALFATKGYQSFFSIRNSLRPCLPGHGRQHRPATDGNGRAF